MSINEKVKLYNIFHQQWLSGVHSLKKEINLGGPNFQTKYILKVQREGGLRHVGRELQCGCNSRPSAFDRAFSPTVDFHFFVTVPRESGGLLGK